MADRPILFSGPMVRAIIEGRKTQTRRVLKSQPEYRGGFGCEHDPEEWGWADENGDHISVLDVAPYRKGNRLYVREAWQALSFGDYEPTIHRPYDLRYAATDPLADCDADVRGYPWRPSIHMPRGASRLTLIVTDVRVQRLQEISEDDAVAEGTRQDRVGAGTFIGREGPRNLVTPWPTAREAFADLWDSLAKPGATWADNPWVVAITFDTHHCNIDAMGASNG